MAREATERVANMRTGDGGFGPVAAFRVTAASLGAALIQAASQIRAGERGREGHDWQRDYRGQRAQSRGQRVQNSFYA